MKDTPQSAFQKLKAHGRKAIYPFKKPTVEDLAENVRTCQENLHFAINLLALDINFVTQDKLSVIDDNLVNGFGTIEDALQQLHLRNQDGQAKILERHEQIKAILNREKDESKAQKIIASLWDDQMDRRRPNIADASFATCNWIFEDEHNRDGRHEVGQRLRRWLRSDAGVFWIAGKPGSGKSTFMKYILEDPRTEDLLQEWAGDRRVIIVHHFFWVAGSQLQRSRQGVSQSLLYQLLKAEPGLVSVACERRLSRNETRPWVYKRTLECYFDCRESYSTLYLLSD